MKSFLVRIVVGGLLALAAGAALNLGDAAPPALGQSPKRISLPLIARQELKAQPGFYSGNGMEFYVSPDGAQVSNLKLSFRVNGCPSTYSLRRSAAKNITAGSFNVGGLVPIDGSFSSPTSASGTAVFNRVYVIGCGYVSGTRSWSATWQNASQPAAAREQGAATAASEEAEGSELVEDLEAAPIEADANLLLEAYPVP
jgi:hypothetical protein